MSSHAPTSRLRRRRRGFTLVELMISLVMGLIVALAAVALARTATTTFHEQARISLTEMGLRTGSERLRQDLMRISHMSTGNIALDPKIAHVAGAVNSRYANLNDLQGVRINVGAGKAGTQGTLKLAEHNFLNPDSIVITGNLTTDDGYNGTITTGGSCAGGQIVTLDPGADAAVYGLLSEAGATLLSNAQSAFVPVSGKTFIAQVVDPLGCTNYVPVCDVTTATVGTRSVVRVHLLGDANSRAVLYSHTESGSSSLANNCGASEGGKVTISPIHRVRWALTASPAALESDPNVEPVGNKFDLTRQLLDWAGADVGTAEIVAEYGVDLKFGVTAWDPAQAAANQPPLRVYEMDSDTGSGDIDKATKNASGTSAGTLGPQHIRSVRFRFATRTSVADRTGDIQIGPARGASVPPYISRYCLEDKDLAQCKKWARVRTVVSEVALHNQARMFY
jgi:prepilin-type N-terminal cleavage/methylation domain-containing protein